MLTVDRAFSTTISKCKQTEVLKCQQNLLSNWQQLETCSRVRCRFGNKVNTRKGCSLYHFSQHQNKFWYSGVLERLRSTWTWFLRAGEYLRSNHNFCKYSSSFISLPICAEPSNFYFTFSFASNFEHVTNVDFRCIEIILLPGWSPCDLWEVMHQL